MGQEAEVADGCPDYPQLKDRGNEGEMEMWEDVLKEAISPSNFLVSALHPEEKNQISRRDGSRNFHPCLVSLCNHMKD